MDNFQTVFGVCGWVSQILFKFLQIFFSPHWKLSKRRQFRLFFNFEIDNLPPTVLHFWWIEWGGGLQLENDYVGKSDQSANHLSPRSCHFGPAVSTKRLTTLVFFPIKKYYLSIYQSENVNWWEITGYIEIYFYLMHTLIKVYPKDRN